MTFERAVVRRFFLSSFVPLIVSLLASYVIYRVIVASNDSLKEVSSSYRQISALNNLMKTVLDAQTGVRGFIITGNISFLEPYNSSVDSIGDQLSALRRLIGSESQDTLSEIDTTFEQWRREVAEVSIRSRYATPPDLPGASANAYSSLLEARRAETLYRREAQPEALASWGQYVSATRNALEEVQAFELRGERLVQAAQLVKLFGMYSARLAELYTLPTPAEEAAADKLTALLQTFSREILSTEQQLIDLHQSGAGKVLIDRIRSYTSQIDRRTEVVLQANLQSGEVGTRQAQIVSFAGPLAAAIFGFVAVILSQRALNRSAHRLTQVTQEVSTGHYNQRLHVKRGDELWQLAHNFNTMATELGSREHQATIFKRMGKMLQTCGDSDELYRITSHFAAELFPTFSGSLYIISASRNMLQSTASWGDFPADDRIHTPQECWAIRQSQVHLSYRRSHNNDIFCHHAPEPKPRESLCIPLMSQDEMLGVFFLYSAQASDPLTSGIQRLAATVAEALALALSNLRLREKLRHQSIRDPLTGLFNRRHLEETLELELHRAARRNEPISLVMFDVDHFKRYNDTFGHDAGDSVLQSVSELAQNHIRAGDVACRYGGEEFLLVQPGMAAENALERAESLRENIAKLALDHRGVALESITISVGIAVYPQTAQTAEELIKRADEALYQAKRGGRNQVVLATNTVETV